MYMTRYTNSYNFYRTYTNKYIFQKDEYQQKYRYCYDFLSVKNSVDLNTTNKHNKFDIDVTLDFGGVSSLMYTSDKSLLFYKENVQKINDFLIFFSTLQRKRVEDIESKKVIDDDRENNRYVLEEFQKTITIYSIINNTKHSNMKMQIFYLIILFDIFIKHAIKQRETNLEKYIYRYEESISHIFTVSFIGSSVTSDIITDVDTNQVNDLKNNIYHYSQTYKDNDVQENFIYFIYDLLSIKQESVFIRKMFDNLSNFYVLATGKSKENFFKIIGKLLLNKDYHNHEYVDELYLYLLKKNIDDYEKGISKVEKEYYLHDLDDDDMNIITLDNIEDDLFNKINIQNKNINTQNKNINTQNKNTGIRNIEENKDSEHSEYSSEENEENEENKGNEENNNNNDEEEKNINNSNNNINNNNNDIEILKYFKRKTLSYILLNKASSNDFFNFINDYIKNKQKNKQKNNKIINTEVIILDNSCKNFNRTPETTIKFFNNYLFRKIDESYDIISKKNKNIDNTLLIKTRGSFLKYMNFEKKDVDEYNEYRKKKKILRNKKKRQILNPIN